MSESGRAALEALKAALKAEVVKPIAREPTEDTVGAAKALRVRHEGQPPGIFLADVLRAAWDAAPWWPREGR